MKNLSKILILIFYFVLPVILTAQSLENCTGAGCHNQLIEPENIHPPLEDDCTTCHEYNEKKHPETEGDEFIFSSEVPKLCYMCHDEPASDEKMHFPVEEGECMVCHSPHSSENQSLLLYQSVGEVCEDCHDLEIAEDHMVHGPVNNNECQICHNPHQSKFSTLLQMDIPDLCFECHDERKSDMDLLTVHAPMENCTNCHLPHNSSLKLLLKDEVPGLCYNCHSDLKDEMTDSTLVHSPFVKEKSCFTCHDVHGSDFETLLIDEQQNICLSCHDEQVDAEERKIKNIKEKLGEGKIIHEAIESGGCTTCHNPHLSNINSLLIDNFPQGKYAAGNEESYALCFFCHDSELMNLEKSESATNFRNGLQNLHFFHVNQEKSRSCINCHDVHGADHQHLIVNHVPFGKWQMPLNYKISETGGSCLPGCHGEKKYER